MQQEADLRLKCDRGALEEPDEMHPNLLLLCISAL